MEADLRAGVAIFNAGEYHAAHDAWEDHWLRLDSGTDDERFLHGLIQFTAAVHHGHGGNWAGASGLARSAGGYLADLSSPYRNVDLGPVRDYLDAVATDPEHVERARPPALRWAGRALEPADLDFEAAAVAATVLAGELDGFDASIIDDAVRYARTSVERGRADRFVALVMDFAGDPEHRGVVYQRLRSHVERQRARERDVDGLF